MLESIQTLANTFFNNLEIDYSELVVTEEDKNIYQISIKSNDSSLLIGPAWKNLETITHLLKLLIVKSSQWRINIHLEVNDYLKQKEQKLFHFIQWKIDQVKSSGEDTILPFLTAYERKKVHGYVTSKTESVYTESKGEGHDRRIYLCKQKEKLTIDIDGDDI